MTVLLFNKLSKLIMRQACSLFFDFQRVLRGPGVGGGGGEVWRMLGVIA